MTAPSAAFLARIALQGIDSLVVLAEVELADGTTKRRAFHPFDVVFDGETYLADAGGFDALRQTLDEESPSFRVAFQNVRDPETGAVAPWATYGDLYRATVTLRTVDRTLLDDAEATLESGPWHVGAYTIDSEACVLECGTPFDALALETLQPSVVSLIRATDRDGNEVRLDFLPSEVRVK
ncbi:MAG: hypothetical protein ACHQ1G_00070 [Planctomycetota bacterium]